MSTTCVARAAAAPCSCALTSVRHNWRRRAAATPSTADRLALPDPVQSLIQCEDPAKGRCMRAGAGFSPGECIVREQPLVRGRCTADCCPCCPTSVAKPGASHGNDCFWAEVERKPGFRQVIDWFRSVSSAADDQPPASRGNHVRICCLLAICIQAAASAGLRSWLLQALRPSIENLTDDSNPIVKNTHTLAIKFAIKIPAPPEGDSLFAPAMSATAWSDQLFRLLINLQTNLFEIDSRTIGIFPSAFLFEHACEPNARMDKGADDRLALTATARIAPGELVTFCYTDDGPQADGLMHQALEERQAFIERSLGFACACAACEAQERLHRSPSCPTVFLDVTIDGVAAGRIVISLRADVAPRTCENFRALCTGERGMGTNGQPLHYQGTALHRIIPGFMAQGGAGVGESIYGPTFEDETFALKHTAAGVVSMANSGPHSNTSGFFICCAKTEWNDGKHVVFGAVARGMNVVRAIEAVGTNGGEPTKSVCIASCGELSCGSW